MKMSGLICRKKGMLYAVSMLAMAALIWSLSCTTAVAAEDFSDMLGPQPDGTYAGMSAEPGTSEDEMNYGPIEYFDADDFAEGSMTPESEAMPEPTLLSSDTTSGETIIQLLLFIGIPAFLILVVIVVAVIAIKKRK